MTFALFFVLFGMEFFRLGNEIQANICQKVKFVIYFHKI